MTRFPRLFLRLFLPLLLLSTCDSVQVDLPPSARGSEIAAPGLKGEVYAPWMEGEALGRAVTRAPFAPDICTRRPGDRAEAEAAFLHSSSSPFSSVSSHADEEYDAILITCNRKRDNHGAAIERAIPADHTFDPDLPSRIVKGRYGYYGVAPVTALTYAYSLSRQGGTWIITLPIEFHWPTARNTDSVDLPMPLADELGLTAAGEVCDPAGSTATGSYRSVEDGRIDAREGDTCRVRRDRQMTAHSQTTTALHHLREYWSREIPKVWDDGVNFEIRPVFVGCEDVPAGLHDACDADSLSSAQVEEWENAGAIWNVRFNLKPQHRPSFTRWALKWNFMYTGTPEQTVAHELGHILGLDDEYGETGEGSQDCDSVFSGSDAYIMCDTHSGDVRDVYRWIITRRYAIAHEGYCDDNADCGEGMFCAGRGLRRSVCEPTRREGNRCSKDEQCAEDLVCRGRPLNGRCLPPLPEEDACQEDADCGDDAFCQRLGTNDCRPVFSDGHTCSRDGQCDSGRCVAGFCRAANECQEDADCASGEWCNTRLGQNRCLADGSLGLGETCSKNRECATGKCQGRGNARQCVCDSDGDCPGAQICNRRIAHPNECLDGGLGLGDSCDKNDQCISGKCQGTGNNRECVCASDGDCASGEFCNTRLGKNRCLADRSVAVGDACDKNRECASGRCQGGECVCDSDGDCPGTRICNRRIARPNQCLAGGLGLGQSCDKNDQCASGKCQGTGNNRECVCASDGDCPGDQVCNTRLGKNRCLAGGRSLGQSCSKNDQCASGKCQGIGNNRECVCSSDSDCPGGQSCKKPLVGKNNCG